MNTKLEFKISTSVINQQAFVNAVQSFSIEQLQHLIDALSKTHRTPGERGLILNQPLPKIDVTALHVAVRAYAVFRNDQAKRDTLNQMIAMLLEAGAATVVCNRPYQFAVGLEGQKILHYSNYRGTTVWQLCPNDAPPALKSYMERYRKGAQGKGVEEEEDEFQYPEPSADLAYLSCVEAA